MLQGMDSYDPVPLCLLLKKKKKKTQGEQIRHVKVCQDINS